MLRMKVVDPMMSHTRYLLFCVVTMLVLAGGKAMSQQGSDPIPAPTPQSDQKGVGLTQDDVAGFQAANVVGANRFALIVGINDYADPNIPDLRTCESDAQAMYELLTDPMTGGIARQNVLMLTGERATFRSIRRALYDLRKVPSNSTVFVYFSGHGAREAGEAYWITQDAELEDLAATALLDRDIQAFVNAIPSQRVVVMLDCCYAAATLKGEKSLQDFNSVLARFTGRGRAYLMAAGGRERVIEARDLGHSIYTYYLLEGLRGDADEDADGVVSLAELTRYVGRTVADEARVRGGIQNPVIRLDDVQAPDQFGLTVVPKRVLARLQAQKRERQDRVRRLDKLEKMFIAEKITSRQYKIAEYLLQAPEETLSAEDRKNRDRINQITDNEVEADQAKRVFEIIDQQPGSVKQQVSKENLNRATRHRDFETARLLERAQKSHQEGDGRTALDALEAVLQFDPTNDTAQKLRKKISEWYKPWSGESETNTIGIRLVYVPPGPFIMGSPIGETGRDKDEVQHDAEVPRGLYMSMTEVTQGQWHAVMGTNPSAFRGVHLPVERVSWWDAVEFCKRLSDMENKTYRLPTEVEWEYACRGRSTEAFNVGDKIGTTEANFDGTHQYPISRRGISRNRPISAASLSPNLWGLYNTHGNVYEWCSDIYSEYDQPVVKPDPQSTANRVIRGGAWNSHAIHVRSANRSQASPKTASSAIGFRVVREIE